MQRTCPICGTSMEGRKPYAIFCAKPCRRKHERARPSAIACKAAYNGKTKSKACVKCGQYGVRPDSLHCSRACKYGFSGSKELVLYVAPPTKVKKPKPLKVSKHIFISGKCARCGDMFTAKANNRKSNKYCSQICGKRAAGSTRRAYKVNAFVGNVYRNDVFARDNYNCALCGDRMRMDLKGSNVWHPHAPTIDHIVPLARGGSHSMDNVQSAHALCNSTKSDGRYQQLA